MEDLTRDEAVRLLRSAKVAHIAVVDGDRPYIGPMSFVYVDDVIVFRTVEGRRLRAIRANANVSVEVMATDPDTGEWRSAIAAGRAEIVEYGVGAGDYVTQLVAKYRASYGAMPEAPEWSDSDAVVVRVIVDEITGRRSGGEHPTRPGRL